MCLLFLSFSSFACFFLLGQYNVWVEWVPVYIATPWSSVTVGLDTIRLALTRNGISRHLPLRSLFPLFSFFPSRARLISEFFQWSWKRHHYVEKKRNKKKEPKRTGHLDSHLPLIPVGKHPKGLTHQNKKKFGGFFLSFCTNYTLLLPPL